MLDPHTTYDEGPTMSTISQDVCWSFVYRRIPLQCSRSITCTYCRRFIIFVHRVPLQYFGADFETICFDWILEEFSWWVLLVASLDNFLLSAEIVRASLLECIGRCASLHIWCQCCLIWLFFYRISWELKIQSIIVDMHWMFCRFAYFISPTQQTQKSIQSESFRQPPIAVSWKNKDLFCSFFKDLSP